MITILFGEVGIGKSYLAQNLSKETGIKFVEGDDFIPKNLLNKMKRGRPLSTNDVDEFVIDSLIPGIKEEYKKSSALIVSQALYLKRHRDLINATFGSKNVRFVWLPVNSIITQLSRLKNRVRGWWWILNALISKPWFEKPGYTSAFCIKNDGDIYNLRRELLLDKANADIM